MPPAIGSYRMRQIGFGSCRTVETVIYGPRRESSCLTASKFIADSIPPHPSGGAHSLSFTPTVINLEKLRCPRLRNQPGMAAFRFHTFW